MTSQPAVCDIEPTKKSRFTPLYIAIAYFTLMVPALMLPTPIFPISAIWFPAGIGWAALLICGRRFWPAITISSFIATVTICLLLNVAITTALLCAAVVATAATLEPLTGVAILKRFETLPAPALIEKKSISAYLAAVVISSLIGATIALAGLHLIGVIPPTSLSYAWLLWFVGNCLGILLVCTLALTIRLGKQPTWKGRRISLGIPILTLTGILLLILSLSTANEEAAADRRLQDRGEQTLELLTSNIEKYTSAMYGLEAFFLSSQFVDRNEFSQFSGGYLQRIVGLRAMGWAPYSDDSSIDEVIAFAKNEGLANYSIRDYGDNAFNLPGNPSYPVLYVEPLAIANKALGYDLLTDHSRREAILSSAKQRKPMATAPVHLITEQQGPLSVLLLHALFSPPNTSDGSFPEPKNDLPSGVVVGALDVATMLKTAFAGSSNDIQLTIIDKAANENLRLLAQHGADLSSKSVTSSVKRPSWTQSFDFSGREWQLQITTGPAFMNQFRGWQSAAILLGSLLITTLLLGIQLLSTGYTARVEKLVNERTKQLSDSNAQLEKLALLEQKNASKLESQAEELVRSNEELQQFAYIASHDMQEPLRSMTGFAKLLERRYGEKLDGPGQEYIGFIVDGAERMRAIIVALLTYSRVGTNTPDFQPVDLQALLANTLHDLQLVVKESNADIQAHNLPTVRGDKGQLSLLMQNLVSNSIKYRLEERPLQIKITAKLIAAGSADNGAHDDSSDGNTKRWQITVADNGMGVNPEHHQRIFEIFKRLHSSVYYPGTGIGLAICQRVVERHGGTIWIESEGEEATAGNEGCRFHFILQEAKSPVEMAAPKPIG